MWKLYVKTLLLATSYATHTERVYLLTSINSLGKPNLWWGFESCVLVSLDTSILKYLYFLVWTCKRVYFSAHAETRNKLEQAEITLVAEVFWNWVLTWFFKKYLLVKFAQKWKNRSFALQRAVGNQFSSCIRWFTITFDLNFQFAAFQTKSFCQTDKHTSLLHVQVFEWTTQVED